MDHIILSSDDGGELAKIKNSFSIDKPELNFELDGDQNEDDLNNDDLNNDDQNDVDHNRITEKNNNDLDLGDDINFLTETKKKKKKDKKGDDDDAFEGSEAQEGQEGDYPYEMLMNRFYDKFYADYPEAKNEVKFTLPQPQVFRNGGRAVIWVNFPQMCNTIKRDPEHVKSYLLSELKTTGSLDIQKRFLIKGKFGADAVATITGKYVMEYVICGNCKRPNTELSKKNRLIYLICNFCHASKTVPHIK